MRKKNYNKHTSFADRFPFIIVTLILVFAIIFLFQFKARFPLPFFSGNTTVTQDTASVSYSILIASPANGKVFNFVNKNEYVPIEINSKVEIEELNYKLNLVINDKNTIKTFSWSPYRYDWQPTNSGEYTLVANLLDSNNKTISSSNKIKFIVNLKYEEETTATETIPATSTSVTEETIVVGIPTINLEVFEGPTYSAGDDICYYRVKATVTGDPLPAVSFSKDDSSGAWGQLKTQINLTRNNPNYTLTAIAKNYAGQAMDSITLTWGCEQ